MTDYIERDLALNKNMFGNTNPIVYRTYAEELIKSIPTADVVEVVRCKDCQYYDKKYHICLTHSEEPDQYSKGCYVRMNEDDFCSYGERKAK